MSIKREIIEGTKIINEIDSSNLVRAEYDTETSKLVVEFKNGTRYEYEDVQHKTYTQFRMAESQGRFFNLNIGRSYEYKKL